MNICRSPPNWEIAMNPSNLGTKRHMTLRCNQKKKKGNLTWPAEHDLYINFKADNEAKNEHKCFRVVIGIKNYT